MPGCWSWPPIWASSTNRRTRSGLSRCCSQQDLDGQVAAEVGVAALEDRAHAAAGDLAVDPVADRAVGIVAAGGPDDRPGLLAGRRCRGAGRGGRVPIVAAIESRTLARAPVRPPSPQPSPESSSSHHVKGTGDSGSLASPGIPGHRRSGSVAIRAS